MMDTACGEHAHIGRGTPAVLSLDRVVERNRALLLGRSKLGATKYGANLDTFSGEREILQHALEEALDLANYLQTRIMQIDGEIK